MKLKTIPANVRDFTEEQAEEVQLVENIQREGLSPLDEAQGYRLLINRGLIAMDAAKLWAHIEASTLISDDLKLKIKQVAERTGKTVNAVTRSVRLLELEKPIQGWIREGKLTITHGNLLLTLSKEDRVRCVKDHVNYKVRNLGPFDKSSYPVSELTAWIERNIERNLESASWDVKATGEAMKMDKAILACVDCPSNTGNHGALFDGATKGSCLNPTCFNKKKNRGFSLQREAYAAKKPWKDLKFIGYVSAGGSMSGTVDTIKGYSVVDQPSKQILKAIEDKPHAFGWGMVKKTKTASPVILIVDEEVIPKKARAKKNGPTQGQLEQGRMDPKSQFIRSYLYDEYPKAADELLSKLKDKSLVEVLNIHGNRMYEWGNAASALFADKDGKVPKKLSVTQILAIMVRMIVAEDSFDWPQVFKFLGGDTKAITKKLDAEAETAWAEKQKTDAAAKEPKVEENPQA